VADLSKIIGYLLTIDHAEGKIMSALSDLQSEDAALTATIATVISEWAAALQAALANGDSAAIEQVVADMQADQASLVASVPASGANTVTVVSPGNLSSSIAAGAVDVTILATDSDATEEAGLVFSATGLPAGLTMDSAGEVSGLPTVTGVNNVVVTATDSTGATGSVSFTWTITV
jgi:hypothetical protein